MNVGYSVSKLKAMIEANNAGNKAYCLDRNTINGIEKLPELTNLNTKASMVVFQDKIHVIGGNGYATRHETWDGQKWTLLDQAPMYIENSCVIVFKDCIHVFSSASTAYKQYHYKYDGQTWTRLSTNTPVTFASGGVCHDGNYIYLIDTNGGFYRYDVETDTYTSLKALSSGTGEGTALFYYNNEIRCFFGYVQTPYNIETNTWGSKMSNTISTGGNLTNSGGRLALCEYFGKVYAITTNSSAPSIFEADVITGVFTHLYSLQSDSIVTSFPCLVSYKGYLHFINGNGTKGFYRYKFGTTISGEVQEDTFVYAPKGKSILHGDVETVEGGYIAKSDTEIVIGE